MKMKEFTADQVVYFATSAAFRKWLARNHAKATELWVGYCKKRSGIESLTWHESVDEALCYGWIDGIRKSIDAERYTNRFTPRKAGSTWSAVNIRKVAELTAAGRMTPAGLKAYQRRTEQKSGIYAYEQRPADLPDPYAATFKRNKKAWTFFQAQPPYYRKLATWWIVSAKQDDTRARRLAQLIAVSAAGRRL